MRAHFLLACATLALAAPLHAADTNPFAQESPLFLHAPQFDRIKDADYLPAFKQAMAQQLAEIERIANDPAAPTFQNTIVAMEKSGAMLTRVNRVFFAVKQANSDPALQQVQATVAPLQAAHGDAIYLNPKLFARVQAVYARREALGLDAESRMLVEVYEKEFIRAGARLSDADKATLRTINKQLSVLGATFQSKLLAGTKAGALVVDDHAKLAGMDAAGIAAAAGAAKDRGLAGKYALPLQNTTQQPALQSLTDRATRQALFAASWTRTEKGDANDTRDTITEIAQLRARKAALLGYPTYAAYVLDDQMAKTPQAVETFLAQLIPATTAKEHEEAADIQAVIAKSGQSFVLEPGDWELYAEQVRKARYDLNEDQLKPYFELDNVLRNGVFYAANKLYGLTFVERKDIPVYQSDVRVFEVHDKDGSTLGLMYFDYFKRDNKAGGAWMSNLVGQSKLLGTKPVIYNVANFTKPAAGQPALLSFDDVTTMFHEFGHALHGFFADETYPKLSGTAVARDFVEFPSQFNEHWALEPDVLKHYAVDYRTHAAMPQALVDKIKKAATFNQGYELGELLAAAKLDMSWHTLAADAPRQDVDAFERQALASTGLDVKDVPTRYRSSYFSHIWGTGYAAGYYAYLWTEMLDDDVYSWMMAHGGMTRENGERLRDLILSRGHTQDYGQMFRSFTGRDPWIAPMLEHRGLKPASLPAGVTP